MSIISSDGPQDGLPHLPDVGNDSDRGREDLGHIVPSVRRGSGGQLGVQAQDIIANLYHNLDGHRKEVAHVFGWRADISMPVVVARLCGLPRMTVVEVLKRLDRNQWLSHCPCPSGRKRCRSDVSDDAESVAVHAAQIPAAPPSPIWCSEDIVPSGNLSVPQAMLDPGELAPQHEGCSSSRAMALAWSLRSVDDPCPYRGLHLATLEGRNAIAALRIGSLAAKILVDGGALRYFESWVNVFDFHFPG